MGGGTVPITIQISNDNFESSVEVLTNHLLTDQEVVNFNNALVLEEGQIYQVRIYYLDEATSGFDDDWAFGFQAFDSADAEVQITDVPGGNRDTDSDGIADHLDIDSDNDGITDNVEAQSTANYIAPSGLGGTDAFVDENMDGLDDRYDDTQAGVGNNGNGYTHSGTGLTPVDTDSDGVADYLDTDSDGDGTSDTIEAGHGASQALIDVSGDADGDGLKDVVEGININDGFDVNDQNVDPLGEFTLDDSDSDVDPGRGNADPLNVDYDFREALDTDGDNVHDEQDIDDDNDGILDVDEGHPYAALETVLTNLSGINIFNAGPFTSAAGASFSDFATGEAFPGGPLLVSTGGAVGTQHSYDVEFPNGINGEVFLATLNVDFTTMSLFDQDGNPVLVELVDATADTRVDGNTIFDVDPSTFSNGNSASGIYRLIGEFTSLHVVHEQATTGTDGFVISFAVGNLDSDNDGIADRLDIDADNDGITDNVEAQSTAGYIAPSGIGGTVDFVDENNDGLDDNYDNTTVAGMASGATGVGLTPVDTDSGLSSADGVADYLDLDSDNDGIEDAAERGTPGPDTAQTGVVSDEMTDADGDGLLDVFEGSDDNDGFDVNDENRDANSIALADSDGDLNGGDGSNADPLNIDSDFREALDTDGDNVNDADDIDDDNDGILDENEGTILSTSFAGATITSNLATVVVEGVTLTFTNDSVVEFNTFISDALGFTTNGGLNPLDGTVTINFSQPVTDFRLNGAGLSNNPFVETFLSNFSVQPTSATGAYSYNSGDGTVTGDQTTSNSGQILWADPTGITSLSFQLNNVGLISPLSFFSDVSFGTLLNRDSDSDGIADHLDIDSDNDGITDNVEAQSTANYIAPSGLGGTAAFVDANRDGLDDRYDDTQAGVGSNGDSTFTHVGTGLTPVDTDAPLSSADGVADYLDADSDNDGLSDAIEGNTNSGLIDATTNLVSNGDFANGLDDFIAVSYTHLTLPTICSV